jgi:hypothetical protein
VIPAASIHALSAVTGQTSDPRMIAMVAPLPSWSVLPRWIVTRKPSLVSSISYVERHQLRAPKRPRETKQEQRTIPQGYEAIAGEGGHGGNPGMREI